MSEVYSVETGTVVQLNLQLTSLVPCGLGNMFQNEICMNFLIVNMPGTHEGHIQLRWGFYLTSILEYIAIYILSSV